VQLAAAVEEASVLQAAAQQLLQAAVTRQPYNFNLWQQLALFAATWPPAATVTAAAAATASASTTDGATAGATTGVTAKSVKSSIATTTAATAAATATESDAAARIAAVARAAATHGVTLHMHASGDDCIPPEHVLTVTNGFQRLLQDQKQQQQQTLMLSYMLYKTVPSSVLALRQLHTLSLRGNSLSELPAGFQHLTVKCLRCVCSCLCVELLLQQ
jgi:hypothetical protein